MIYELNRYNKHSDLECGEIFYWEIEYCSRNCEWWMV